MRKFSNSFLVPLAFAAMLVVSAGCSWNNAAIINGVPYKENKTKPFVNNLIRKAVVVTAYYRCKDFFSEKYRYNTSRGSGVVHRSFRKVSYVLTARHVMYKKHCTLYKTVVTRYARGNKAASSYRARLVLKSDAKKDIAVLKVKGNLRENTRLAKKVFIGQVVHSLGFPINLRNTRKIFLTYAKGEVAAVGFSHNYVRFTSTIFFGNSGGAIYDNRGRIVSLATVMYHWRSVHIEYYGPSSKAIRKFLKRSKYRFLLK